KEDSDEGSDGKEEDALDDPEDTISDVGGSKMSRKEKAAKKREAREDEAQYSSIETLRMQKEQPSGINANLGKVANDSSSSDSSSSSDDETEDEDGPSSKRKRASNTDNGKPVLSILKEIREVGAKAALMAVAQTLAHVFMTQLPYLISNKDAVVSTHDSLTWTCRCDLTDDIVSKLVELLQVVRDVVGVEGQQSQTAGGGRRRGRQRGKNSGGDQEMIQILWNAMSMKLEATMSDDDEEEKEQDELAILEMEMPLKEKAVLSWIVRLQKQMSPNLCSTLAKEANLGKTYLEFMNGRSVPF
ncbi:MAG: hypothetical protein SGARI_002949, partial [Bacillariaceae sp.]